MNALKSLAIGIAALAVTVPAKAQVVANTGEQFVTAVAEGKGGVALSILRDKPSLIDARNASGQTALVAAIDNRDREWVAFLIQKGADPNLAGAKGETPLMAAVRVGLADAVQWLLGAGARVDDGNRMGETPLIIAVQRRQVPIVRILIAAGADPDKTDSAQGYSARDYAKRDNRTPELLRLIEAKKPKP